GDLGGRELAQVARDLPPLGERPSEEVALPLLGAQLRAQRHVTRVVRAEQVAVRQQSALAAERHALVVAEQARARCLAEPLAQQEVAVTVHERARDARAGELSECGDDRLQARIVVVVADPRLEQVAQDVQVARGARGPFHELDEPARRLRVPRSQVQVGDEERGHFPADSMSSMRSMTIGSTGTLALKGPPPPVGRWPMSSTTSMPSTTLPNTA